MMVTHGNWAKQKKQEKRCLTTLLNGCEGSTVTANLNFRNLKFAPQSSFLFLAWVSAEVTGTIFDKTKGIDMYLVICDVIAGAWGKKF